MTGTNIRLDFDDQSSEEFLNPITSTNTTATERSTHENRRKGKPVK